MRHYSTDRAVCSDQSENNFDDFDLTGSGEEISFDEFCAALDTIPDTGGVSQKVIEAVSAVPKGLSKKVTACPRRSDRGDRVTLRKIQLFQIPGAASGDLPLVGAPHPSIGTPSSSINPPANDNRIPVWKFTSDRAKLVLSCEAFELLGESEARPFSFSLNLTPEREREALRHPKGFTACLRLQIERDLKRAGLELPYLWFAVDIEGDRLHLHGGLLAPPEDIEVIKAALCRSGGSQKGKGAAYQLDIQPRCDHGWATYAIRNRGKVRKVIGGHTVSISQPLRSQARWLYEQYRTIMRRGGNFD